MTAPVRQTLLEQQYVGEWPRSVLSFCRSADGFAAKTPSEQFDLYVQALRDEFDEPKDSKCRRLASELSAMVQDPSESIDQFAFKYKNVLHQLDKLMSPRKLFRNYSRTLLSTLSFKWIKSHVSIRPSKLHVASNNPSLQRPLSQSR